MSEKNWSGKFTFNNAEILVLVCAGFHLEISTYSV